ncbi:hypothetical protein Dsin_016524 [Dipteronia sinensis]|uniref:Uncharacterized protein n=1 Tax=Dipteronia sinensis TaxID=43782 RepID=A0AAE0AE18_9ROSI|nr:hypothetical protein Dsin_016524 [Dipteronia sinensis]
MFVPKVGILVQQVGMLVRQVEMLIQTQKIVLWVIRRQVGDGGQHRAQYNEEKPPFSKILADTISLLKKSHQSSWEKVKAVLHGMRLQFFPPNLDFRGGEEVNGGESMKEAAKKSIRMSKTSVEKSAKSAAEMVGEAVENTAEKVKNTVSNKEDYSQDEL